MDRLLEDIDQDRRRYLTRLAVIMAGAGVGVFSVARAVDRASRDLSGLDRATAWLNSPPLTASRLAGRAVLVDFWTYTCVNWLRTLPYLRVWARKYRDRLVVVGVHTPEFPFEHDIDNVRRAVGQLAVEYPVAIDNDYANWRAFRNQAWPTLLLVDARGRVRDYHVGEGKYDQLERKIRKLLGEAGGDTAGDDGGSIIGTGVEAPADWSNLRSPESYLGSAKAEGFVSAGGLRLNQWALVGEWTMTPGHVALQMPNGRLRYRFHARDVNLIMGGGGQRAGVRFRVSLDGQPPGAAHGVDADTGGNGTAAEPRMYQLIRQPGSIVDRHFEIEFLDAGVEAFAFTFG
jgi:thiol-disulfide isomerase/thioredoxin